MKTDLILVDYSWCLHRYNHSFKNLSVEIKGKKIYTGVYYGFTNLVDQLITGYKQEKKGVKIIFCLDSKDTFRKALYPEYKANRDHKTTDKEILYSKNAELYQILSMSPNVIFASAKGYEADDLLAKIALDNRSKFDKVIIYSGDRDMYQLFHKGVSISNKIEYGKLNLITEEIIKEKFNNCDIDCLLEFRAMLGDKSDNINSAVPLIPTKIAIKIAHDVHNNTNTLEPKEVKWLDKFKLNLETYKRNFQLMDLLKYEVDTELKINYTRSFSDARYLVEQYRLTKYQSFLMYCESTKEVKI